jgi:hypothetical protein
MGGRKRGGQGIIKKKKNKKGIRNYPIPNYGGRKKRINPLIKLIENQPKSNLTLSEHLESDEYRKFIKNRGINNS